MSARVPMSSNDGNLNPFGSSTIMIVDDEPTTIDVVKMFLEAEGFGRVVTTTDSRRALDLLAKERPDVVLLNLMMPQVDGFEILDSMRKDERLQNIPAIILTSSTDPETKLKARALGATDFLAKPVDPTELALRLRSTFAARAYRDHLRLAERAGVPVAPGEQGSSRPDARTNEELQAKSARRWPRRKAAQAAPPLVSRLAGKGPRRRAIIQEFVGRLQEKLETMQASSEVRDFEELASLAHWLRGAAGTVGFDAFTAPAVELKRLADERKENEIEASIRELRELAERIVVPGEDDG